MRYNQHTGTLVSNGHSATFSLYNKSEKRRNVFVLIASIAVLILAVIGMFYFHEEMEMVHEERTATSLGKALFGFLFLITLVRLSFFVYQIKLFLKYKPIESVSDEELPTCTVVVPAFNEGQLVYFTLLSVAQSDYPKGKLEIWAIDDGSTDETWYWISKAKEKLGSRLKIYKQPVNKGKKHALYYGFKNGNGDVFVTIDSDSTIEKSTLRNLVSPIVKDDNCGAVAGNVHVMNKNEGMIPKMLHTSFVFSFEFIRSAQSALGFVLCTPGALAAYKREAIINVMDEWLNQQFLGQPATIGEDRSITNAVLAQGFEVKFQKNAIVETNTPNNFTGLHKMFTRWGRSDVRETLMMNQYMFKNYKKGNKLGSRFIFFNQWMRLLLAIPTLFLMFFFLYSHPLLFLSSALSGIFIIALIQALFFAVYYNFREAFWSFPYGIFNLFALFWIAPYSILTVRKSGWLTR